MPVTGVGRFDCAPHGVDFRITHRLLLVNNASKLLAQADFDAWKNRFRQLIAEHCEDEFGFRRGDIILRPRFQIDFIDDSVAGTAHYIIDVKDSNLPGPRAASSSRATS